MSDVTINVTVTQGGTIDADLSSATVVNTQIEQGGQIAATVFGGGKGATGDTGATGATGSQGPQGDPGEGVPVGGLDDQLLRKTSGVDYETEWHTPVKADIGLSNVDNTSDANKPVSTAQATAIGVVQSDINTHEANTSNPHSVTKTQVGLSNADNTSDVSKPISTATQTALDAKVTGPASVTDDNPAVFDGTTGKLIKQKTYAAFKTLLALVKGDVGLGNVDNTSDVNKPVSTAQQTAIDAKVIDSIADSDTTHAPSRNAVFDALANKQPLDTDLTTIAGLTATTDNFMVATSSAWASRTPTQARSQMGLGSIAVLSTITEADITLADNTTNNYSTTKHGFVPKATNVGNFLKDDGTWAAVPGGGDALTSNPLSQFAATTSLQLKGVLSDETGSGAAVFATSPALVTPTGIVKGDVGLGNVDNTSNTTERAATATLTNKTISGASNTLTSLPFSALLSTIFSGQVSSQANAGSAGGTIYYLNLGGVKLLWGRSASQNTGTGGTNFTITLPVGYFTTVYSVVFCPSLMGTSANQYANGNGVAGTTTWTYNAGSAVNGSTQTTDYFGIGV